MVKRITPAGAPGVTPVSAKPKTAAQAGPSPSQPGQKIGGRVISLDEIACQAERRNEVDLRESLRLYLRSEGTQDLICGIFSRPFGLDRVG